MAPVLSAGGVKINWLNYKTGIRFISFRLYADNRKARISIEITHADKDIRDLYFEQFVQLKHLLHTELKEPWTWAADYRDDMGKPSAVIHHDLPGVNR